MYVHVIVDVFRLLTSSLAYVRESEMTDEAEEDLLMSCFVVYPFCFAISLM